jgi:hypothetical protein
MPIYISSYRRHGKDGQDPPFLFSFRFVIQRWAVLPEKLNPTMVGPVRRVNSLENLRGKPI